MNGSVHSLAGADRLRVPCLRGTVVSWFQQDCGVIAWEGGMWECGVAFSDGDDEGYEFSLVGSLNK